VKEFLSFSHPEEDPAMRPHVLAQVLKEKDTDGDEELSFQGMLVTGVRARTRSGSYQKKRDLIQSWTRMAIPA